MTDRDIEKIADAVYRKLDENALGDIRGRLDGIDGRLDGMDKKIYSMAEDVAKIPLIEGEIRLINQNIAALCEHAEI